MHTTVKWAQRNPRAAKTLSYTRIIRTGKNCLLQATVIIQENKSHFRTGASIQVRIVLFVTWL